MVIRNKGQGYQTRSQRSCQGHQKGRKRVNSREARKASFSNRFFCRLVLIAADIFPIDVIAHLPVLCEEANIPYCYVNSRSELGESCLSKRPTSIILISSAPKDEEENYKDCVSQVKAMMV